MRAKYIVLIIMISINTRLLHANINKEIKRYKNCYSLFVGLQIDANDSRMLQIISSQKTGIDACAELLAEANLDINGFIAKNQDGSYKKIAIDVMRQMNQVHKGFYKEPSYIELPELSTIGKIAEVFDDNQPAYYWSNALFSSTFNISDIVKSNYHFEAQRFSTRKSSRQSINHLNGGALNLEAGWAPIPTLVQLGLLVGFKIDNEVFSNTNLIRQMRGRGFESQNANQHFGAGVLGTNEYFIANAGRYGYKEESDGGLKMYRRWSKHVIEDFLCREFPALRSSDVISEIQPQSPFPFRNGISCMQCHSTMDPMAGNVRNILAHSISSGGSPPMTHFKIPTTASQRSPLLPINEADTDFSKRPPSGRIKYRSYDGSLIEKSTENLQELGNFLATTNDFYVCAAKKYYKYLTGINVDLADPGDINSKTLNKTEQFHRDKVIQLGVSLKSHKDLQRLIKEIIETDSFLYPTKKIQ